jgi:hypothetical protein
MKLTLFAVGLVATAITTGNPAKAQNYPWCAQYSTGRSGGGMNCGFVSFNQCMATVSGIGGFCIQNNTYVPPPGPHPTTRSRKRAHH